MSKYTLRILNGSRSDSEVETFSVPRIGETIVFGGSPFLVTGVRHVVEPDDIGLKCATLSSDIIVLCRES